MARSPIEPPECTRAHRHFANNLLARKVEEERVEGAGDEQAATVGTETQLVDGVEVLVEEALCGRGRGGRRDGAIGAGARRRRRGRRGLDGGRAVVRRARHDGRAGGGGRRGGEARGARDGRRRGARAALDARVGLRARCRAIPLPLPLLRVRPAAGAVGGGVGAGVERELVLGVRAAYGLVVSVPARALEHAARADLVEQLEVAGRRVPELERAVRVPAARNANECEYE